MTCLPTYYQSAPLPTSLPRAAPACDQPDHPGPKHQKNVVLLPKSGQSENSENFLDTKGKCVMVIHVHVFIKTMFTCSQLAFERSELSVTRIRTQHDLARLLNVSRVTVQRALSDHPYVNDGLRAEIQAAAKKYGYRPFANAQSLRTVRPMPSAFYCLISVQPNRSSARSFSNF